MSKHDLIKTGDTDAFFAIKDRNGEVVLDYCRRCRQGEGELTAECPVAVITSADITNDKIEELLVVAILDEDGEMVELCETTQKTIVRMETVAAARMEIARILNARAAVAARRCNKCGALCDHEGWNGIGCPWCASAANKAVSK